MEHRLIPRGVKLEDNSGAERAAKFSGTVKVARLVHDQSCERLDPIGSAREAVQHCLIAGGVKFEHGPAAGNRNPADDGAGAGTALCGGSIEVARIHD